MTRRILTITIAIVLALVGTGAVLLYVKQAVQGSIDKQKPVSVLVAAQQVPAGTTAATALADGLLTKQNVPAGSVPADHVSAISPALGSLVFSADVPPGELVLRPMLVTAVQATSGLAIPSGMVAVTIPLCVPQEVAGYVYPGAQVAVFDTVSTGSGSSSSSTSTNSVCQSSGGGSAAKVSIRTRVLLPKVTVLAIGQAPAPGTSPSVTSSAFGSNGTSNASAVGNNTVLVTFAVDQSDAERVITLAQSGLPYLALLTKSSTIGPDPANLPLFPAYK